MLFAAYRFFTSRLGRIAGAVGGGLIVLAAIALKAYLAGRAAVNEKIRRDTLQAKERRHEIDQDTYRRSIDDIRDELRRGAD